MSEETKATAETMAQCQPTHNECYENDRPESSEKSEPKQATRLDAFKRVSFLCLRCTNVESICWLHRYNRRVQQGSESQHYSYLEAQGPRSKLLV